MMNFQTHSARSARQTGNTLIGVIVGLVIGLVIAVVVALAITKGATPFTDKLGKTGKTAEPSVGQVTDPNKPMYGNKETPKLAPKDTVKAPTPPPADPLQQVISGFKPDPVAAPAPVKPPARPEAKPEPALEPAAKVAVLEKSKPADAGEDKFIYYLQAGAFRELDDAESVRAKLALLGFEAAVTDRSTDSGVLHRVRIGPYQQVETMNRARTKLADNGVDVAVVRNQK